MAIARLKKKEEPKKADIEAFISKGGGVLEENTLPEKEEVRMTFRCPKDLIDELDKMRKIRPGVVSRNQAIVEAIGVFVTSK